MAFGRVQERRAHPRSKMRVEAKLMLADRRELGCTITDVSANGMAVLARESGAVGEMVVVYVAEAGRLQGQIVRVFDGGFAIKLNGTSRAVELLARRFETA